MTFLSRKIIFLKMLIAMVILIVSCATVNKVGNEDINTFLNSLLVNQNEIEKMTIRQVDRSLEVKFWLKDEKIDPHLRDEIFKKTRDFLLSESTQAMLEQELKHNEPIYDGRISIRFQKDTSDIYWVYSLDNQEPSKCSLTQPNTDGYAACE
jgi:hypothetical protein